MEDLEVDGQMEKLGGAGKVLDELDSSVIISVVSCSSISQVTFTCQIHPELRFGPSNAGANHMLTCLIFAERWGAMFFWINKVALSSLAVYCGLGHSVISGVLNWAYHLNRKTIFTSRLKPSFRPARDASETCIGFPLFTPPVLRGSTTREEREVNHTAYSTTARDCKRVGKRTHLR